MTKSVFEQRIDAIMEKHQNVMLTEMHLIENRFDSKLSSLESRVDNQFLKIDHRYNWIIGTIFAVGLGLASLFIKFHT